MLKYELDIDEFKLWFHIHYLSGYFLGRLLKLERKEKIILILAAVLPDIDILIYFLIGGFQNPASFHAGITHTLIIGFLMSTILAIVGFGIIKRWKDSNIKNSKLIRFFILGLIGITLHLILDINTIANEYGEIHHLYFWPASDVSYHLDILLADIFPRYPYFDFSKLLFLKYSPNSFKIVQILTLIINGVFLAIVIYEWVPLRKVFPWDPFMYNSDRLRDPWIGDNTEIILNILLTLIFFGLFVIRIDYLLKALIGKP